MMDNKEIIDKLIYKSPVDAQEEVDDDSNVLITAHRIVSIRYKLYFFIIFVVLLVIYLYFLEPIYTKWLSNKSQISSTQTQIESVQMQISQSKLDQSIVDKIAEQEQNIINMFNNNGGTGNIYEILLQRIDIIKNYIQLNKLEIKRLTINEKMILANINEYLFISRDGNINGIIKSISIGESEIQGNFYHIPIMLTADFENKDALMSFVKNIETYIQEISLFRILYKINEISYDVVKYEEEQEVTLSLSAFYLK